MANENKELSITRTYNAHRELVFSLWTDPLHVAKWWGPEGFTTTIHEMEVWPGGIWNLTMHGPDGTDYMNESIFVEVVKPEKLVYEHISTPKHTTTILFTELGEKTEVTVNMLFESPQQMEQVIKVFKADIGLEQHMDKLGKYLSGFSK